MGMRTDFLCVLERFITLNLSRSREKKATAKQAFSFPGAIPKKSKVRSTTGTKWLDFRGGTDR